MIQNYSKSKIEPKLLGSNMISSETQRKIIKHPFFYKTAILINSEQKSDFNGSDPTYKLQVTAYNL